MYMHLYVCVCVVETDSHSFATRASGMFTLGTTTHITHTARDADNNTASCSFSITVEKDGTIDLGLVFILDVKI
jgi:hypothetical protein